LFLDLPVRASGAQFLVVTYHNDLGLPVLATFEIKSRVYCSHVMSPIRPQPASETRPMSSLRAVLAGRSKVTIRFVAAPDTRISPVYDIRITHALGSKP
jgi:hypothetical protein